MVFNGLDFRRMARLGAVLMFLSAPAGAVQARVFGDGDPANGTEDSRVPLTAITRRDSGWEAWDLNAGTIHCDGRVRGSATVLDPAALGHRASGLVLITAAHVFFDLDEGRPFRDCRFHFLGLDRVPGYQRALDLSAAVLGDFDPRQERGADFFGRGDWALLYVPGPVPAGVHAGTLIPRTYASLQAAPGEAFSYHLLGWNADRAMLHISGACQVRHSSADDLGGGAWPGQLLDDCDSGQGASGGALVATRGAERYLVGIRGGAHWHPEVYPAAEFPDGPPTGSPWNVAANTNYCRAIDGEILLALGRMLRNVEAVESPEQMGSLP